MNATSTKASAADTRNAHKGAKVKFHLEKVGFSETPLPQAEFDALVEVMKHNDKTRVAEAVATVAEWKAEPEAGKLDREDAVEILRDLAARLTTEQFRDLATRAMRDMGPRYVDRTISMGDEMFKYSQEHPEMTPEEIGEALGRSSRNTVNRYLRIGGIRKGFLPQENPDLSYSDPAIDQIIAEMIFSGDIEKREAAGERVDAIAELRERIREKTALTGDHLIGIPADNRFTDLLLRYTDYQRKIHAPREKKTSMIADLREVIRHYGEIVRQSQYNDYWAERDFTAADGHAVLNSSAISRHCRWTEIVLVADKGCDFVRNDTEAALHEVSVLCRDELDVDITEVSYALADHLPKLFRSRILNAIAVLSMADPAEAMMPFGGAARVSPKYQELSDIWTNSQDA